MIFTKKIRFGKLKTMISGGISRIGKPYVYAGAKTKSGISVGASIGSEGKKIYGSINKSANQARIRHNATTGETDFRVRTNIRTKKTRSH